MSCKIFMGLWWCLCIRKYGELHSGLNLQIINRLCKYMISWTDSCKFMQVIAIALLVIYLFQRRLFTRYSNLPPGPSGLPVIGSLLLFGELPHQKLAKMATEYGPLISLRLGQKLGIVASSPTMAMEFLKNQDANFSSRPYSRSAEVLSYQGGVWSPTWFCFANYVALSFDFSRIHATHN